MLKKLIGLGLVLGLATSVSALTGGCSSTTTTVNDDGGIVKTDGGHPPSDGGGDIDSGPGGGNCPVKITTMDIIEVNPPKAGTQGSCTDTELGKVTGKFADILAAVSATCAACLFTESTDMTNSQFFIWSDNTHTSAVENIGACFGSDYSGGSAKCGKAAEEVESCLQAACPTDAMGVTMCTDITDQECVTQALAGDCKTYNDKQTTDCGGATALKAIFGKCFDSKGSPNPGIKLVCGGAAAGDSGGGG